MPSRKLWTKREAADLKRWLEVDLATQSEIASRLKIGRNTVMREIRRRGLLAQRTGPRSGPKHPDWKGGRSLDPDGYVLLYLPTHPHARQRGASPPAYVLEHRVVMEKHLGRLLDRAEVVHHKNGDRSDNRVANLELFAKNSDHLKHELTGRCPKWTPAGRARILAAARKPKATRKK